jgi:hypothetical protein
MSSASPAKPPITAPAIVPDDGEEEDDKRLELGLELTLAPDVAVSVWITSETLFEGGIEVEFEDVVGNVVLVFVPVAVRVIVIVLSVGARVVEGDVVDAPPPPPLPPVAGALVLVLLSVVIVKSASLPSNSTESNKKRASLPVVTIFNVC